MGLFWEATPTCIVKASLDHSPPFSPEKGRTSSMLGRIGSLGLPSQASQCGKYHSSSYIIPASRPCCTLGQEKSQSWAGSRAVAWPAEDPVTLVVPERRPCSPPVYGAAWVVLAFSKSSWIVRRGIRPTHQTFASIWVLPLCTQLGLCAYIQTPSLPPGFISFLEIYNLWL